MRLAHGRPAASHARSSPPPALARQSTDELVAFIEGAGGGGSRSGQGGSKAAGKAAGKAKSKGKATKQKTLAADDDDDDNEDVVDDVDESVKITSVADDEDVGRDMELVPSEELPTVESPAPPRSVDDGAAILF